MDYQYLIQNTTSTKIYISKILPKQYVGSIHHWTYDRKNALIFWDQDAAQNIQRILEQIGIETTVIYNRENNINAKTSR